MKNDFECNILNKLLDKYENSKLSKGGTTINRKIVLTTKDDELKTYTVSDSYKYVDANDLILKELEKKGFIKTQYYLDNFKSLELVIENVDKIYEYLKRKNPKEELLSIVSICDKYKFKNFLNDFISYIKGYVSEKYSYPKDYFKDSLQLDLILKCFEHMFKIDSSIRKRDFSSKYLGDSKAFETIEGKIVRIVKDFSEEEFESDEDVLLRYNIVKNSTYALVKNKLIFKLNDVVIDLDKLGYEFSFSDDMIKKVEILSKDIKKVVTIENLTSFYSWKDSETLCIFLSGFHNHTKQDLLKKIYEKYPNATYLHFGDIDAGGFWIYQTLVENTGIPFIPFKMNKEILICERNNCKSLTKHDIERLKKMEFDDRFFVFRDTIRYMLDNNIKLEQENLDD